MSTFTAEQVWGCAAAAQRINGAYVKEVQYGTKNGQLDHTVILKKPNKEIVKGWLRDQDFSQITEIDYAAGRTARDHFKSYTLLAIAGRLNDFQSQALKIAAKDEFTGRDLFDFSVISCLPSVAQRDAARTELKQELYASEQLVGNLGDEVVGEITVVSSRFNPNYNKHRIVARMGDSFIDFWFSRELEGQRRIKGKIKAVRDDKTTQLNYVKVL